MTLNEIFAAIRATSSKLEKRAILAQHKDNELLREFLKAVYDPRINFNIKKLPDVSGSGVVEREFTAEDLSDFVSILPGLNGGKKAKEFLKQKLASLDFHGCDLVEYLIARNVKAGMAENSVLEVWPGLFYVPPYQRCAKLDEKRKAHFESLPYFYVQTKSDGQFCYAIKRKVPAGSYNVGSEQDPRKAMSRTGSLYPAWVANHITYGVPEGHVAMGELLVVRDGKTLDRKTGNGILNSVLSGDGSKFLQTDSIRFVAWDMVTEDEFDAGRSIRDYDARWSVLEGCTALERQKSWRVKSIIEAGRIQQEHLARGEEGTVWKDPSMGWRDCQSGDPLMVKAKVVFQADFEIEGYYEGEGKAAGMLGGLSLRSRDGLIRFDCGSGYDDATRKYLWSVRYNLPGKIVAVEGNDIVTSKSKETEAVFLPIFLEIREDKSVADNREEVWAEFEAAKKGRSL